MPGRLLTRSLTSPLDPQASVVNTAPSRRPATGASGQSPSPSSAMEHFKRHSLAAIGKRGSDHKKSSGSSLAHASEKPASSLEIIAESPPAIFYGNANNSSGALYAGQLRLNVVEPEIVLNALTLKLIAITTAKKPVAKDCQDCASQTTELKHWNFLTHQKRFERGAHSLPFSYLIPGHLPITTHGTHGMIQYFLDAKATKAPSPQKPVTSPTDTTVSMRRELKITRAVRPLDQKISLRIFPPTNLTARITHEPIIHQIGEFNIQMVVSGITEKQTDTQSRWRLRRMNWRLEETEKMVSPACPKHAAKVGGEGRGISHEDTRTVGRGELKSGWKTDLSEGSIELDFVLRPSKPLCDVDSPNGLLVTHSLVIELVIAEEWANNKTPEKATPTGAARVLRMQFAVMVTERSGMGISWDEEQPPMYEDVPASPPWYPDDDIRNPYAGGSAPPGYAEGVEGAESLEMQSSRSELLEYTGTPLSPTLEREEIEDFEGLSIGPSRMHQNTVASRSAAAGPSRPPTQRHTASNLGRSQLSAEDFETDEVTPPRREDEDDSTPRPPSPQRGNVS